MRVTERDKKRIDALIAIIKLQNSLAAKLDALSADDLAHYQGWKASYDRWIEDCRRNSDPDEREGRPYESLLRGYGPVELRGDIAITLFGPRMTIPITATEDDAAMIYYNAATRKQR